MHDLLFRNQSALRLKDLRRYAEQLSLDTGRFVKELKDHNYDELVRHHFKLGVQNGVYATPGLFINGVRLLDPLTSIRAHMQKLIDESALPVSEHDRID